MSQPIITTDISAVRPVFSQGTAENIKRFSQLKKMFAEGREYTVLAEPVADGTNKVTWHTEFDGTPESFNKLSEEERDRAKGRIKYQVNRLYKAVFKQLYRGKLSDVADMFQVLDSCIEIPDYSNIYRITSPNGTANYVLIKWGFTTDDFNASSGLIKKLVPLKVDTIKIKLFKNKKPAPNEMVCVSHLGKNTTLETDSMGYVSLEDVPLGDQFSAWVASDKNTLTEYACDGRDEYHLLSGTKSADMIISFVDKYGDVIPDTEVTVTIDGKTYIETTDANGNVKLPNIPEGTEITCKQKTATQSFVCNPSSTKYIFHGIKAASEIEISICDDNNEGVQGVEVTLSYGDKKIELESDRQGKVSIDNMPIDTEFAINCLKNGYNNTKSRLFSHEGLNISEIKMRKISKSGPMRIKVVDDKGEPIVNTLIRCENNDVRTELYTDDNGEIVLPAVNFGSQVVCTQIVDTLASHRHIFTFEPEDDNYVLKGKKILSKGGITDFEIHVINKKKQDIPNLRVNIDDGHNVLNKITNSQGRINIAEFPRGVKQKISTEYKNKTTEIDYTCTKEKEVLTISVGRSPLGFLLWLIPLILAGLFLIWKFLVPVIVDLANNPVVVTDTTHKQVVVVDTIKTDTIIHNEPIVKQPEGLTIIVKDEKSGQVVENAKINISFNGKSYDGTTDSLGRFNFKEVPSDSTLQITANVKSDDGKKEFLGTFLFSEERIISISEQSQEVSDEILSCGETIKSKGYHSTIKTINVKKEKGTLKILYDMFSIPDELIVYRGKASEISDDKIIYRTKGYVKGPYKVAQFAFNAPGGIITVRINGGDNSKTEWYFKVYCPK